MEFMAKIPRVEISETALKVLKIEAALSGLPQKAALEALILRGASSRTLALVDGKPALDKVDELEEMEAMKEKPAIPTKPAMDKMELPPEARTALEFILSDLESGNRPTISEIAGKLEITTVALGRMLNPLGLKAHNTHKDGKSAKVYEPSMKTRIKEILGKN